MKPKILITRAIFPEVVERLQAHAEVEANQDDILFDPAEMARRLADKDGVLVVASRIDAVALGQATRLRVVSNMAVGYNNLDIEAMTRAHILATNTPDVLNETTADLGWVLMMAAARRITESEHWLRAGHWKQWGYELFAGTDIYGATLGIVGMGRIGQAIARRARGFGMRVIYHNRSQVSPEIERELNAEFVDKTTLMKQADHVMLVVPYSAATHHIIGAAELALMKPSATLTNIARGGIVDETALIAALREHRIAAAGLDVFEGEPKFNPAFLELSNVVLTPHIGSASLPTRRAMAHLAVDNLLAGLGLGPQAGNPPNPINPEVLGASRG
jgi:glyoxylate/hydroxypyruvate/2-ketogluconate reductase